MRNFTRVIIVRRGDTAAFECLRQRFHDDPSTIVMYDRRRWPRDAGQGARQNRRWPEDPHVLCERGFFVVSRVRSAPEAMPQR